MSVAAPPSPDASPTGTLVKFVSVRRSNLAPTLYWWTLPIAPRTVWSLYATALSGARAVVFPATALGAKSDALGARPWPGSTARIDNVQALLEGRDDGSVGPCTIAFFPPTVRDEELERRMPRFERELERLPFTIAMLPDGDGRARHRFCFRVPGKVIEALEHLALGRGFGGNPGQVEMALLQGLTLRPSQEAALRLVMQDGKAHLVGIDTGGRRRVQYLESDRGYTGLYEELSMRDAVAERLREGWRRFPIGVVMFVGLPFFIAAFWISSFLRRGVQAAAKPGHSSVQER
jgi:hypothetical protein